MPDALVERDGHTMVITMNRPKRFNALTGAMLVRMYDAMVEACADDDIRSIILTGAEGNFCSGADLRAMAGDAEDTDTEIDVPARMADDPDLPYKGLLRHYQPSKPLHRRGRGRRHRRRHRAAAGHRHPRRRRVGALRRERGALVAVPDGGIGRPPAPPDPLHARGGDPAHRQAPPRRRGRAHRADRPRRARRSGAHQGQEIAEQINNNGPLAVEAILRTLRETDGMTEAGSARARVRVRPGRLRVRRRQGRPEGLRREAHPQLPAQVAPRPARLRRSTAICTVR